MLTSRVSALIDVVSGILQGFYVNGAYWLEANAGQSGAVSVSVVEAMIAVSHSNTPFCIISGWIIAQLSVKGKL